MPLKAQQIIAIQLLPEAGDKPDVQYQSCVQFIVHLHAHANTVASTGAVLIVAVLWFPVHVGMLRML